MSSSSLLPQSLFFSFPSCPSRPLRRRLLCSPPLALPISDQNLIQTLISSPHSSSSNNHLPAIRSYDNDLSNLTLVGAVSSSQALTAAAADGGDAANEHLTAGLSTMVVETVFPGPSDDRSTVSTRLFLPAKEVKEKAAKLTSKLSTDILLSNPDVSKNILAITFRQVVMHQLWSFKLSLFPPGSERNMEDLGTPREIDADFSVSSSDGRFLSSMAEVLCAFALDETERRFNGNIGDTGNTFLWFQTAPCKCSADSSVCVYKIPENEVVKNALSQMEKYNSMKTKSSFANNKLKHQLLVAPKYSKLEKVGGSDFSSWANEFIPAYKVKIDGRFFEAEKLEGWHQLADNRWEVLLTHLQMVELASILDMYYEDRYTLPDKKLVCSLPTQTTNVSRNKVFSWKMLSIYIAGSCIFILVGMLAQVCRPYLTKVKELSERNISITTTDIDNLEQESLDITEAGPLCMLVVEKIKNALGWPGDVKFDANVGAWTGLLPGYLRNAGLVFDHVSGDKEHNTGSLGDTRQPFPELPASVDAVSESVDADVQTAAQDIASFQVLISRDGKIIGFQPTSRIAVNHWASNPLARELYGGRKLSPGLFEPKLDISLPSRPILLELLMSTDPGSSFALARPI